MSYLWPCRVCARHVRAESECPFCGAGRPVSSPVAPVLPTTRLRRAALLAFRASTVAAISTLSACGDDAAPTAAEAHPSAPSVEVSAVVAPPAPVPVPLPVAPPVEPAAAAEAPPAAPEAPPAEAEPEAVAADPAPPPARRRRAPRGPLPGDDGGDVAAYGLPGL